MARVVALALTVSRILALAGGVLIAVAALAIAAEILLRVTGRTIGGVDELSGYALAVGTSWSLAFCLLEKGHIRIDTIYTIAPDRIRAWLDVAALALLSACAALLAWHAADVWLLALEFMSRSLSNLQVPLWIPQGLWTLGLVWFCIVSVILLVGTAAAMLAGDYRGVSRMFGIATADTELEAELADLRRRGARR